MYQAINTRNLVSRLNFTNVHFMKLTNMCRFYEFYDFHDFHECAILWFSLNLNCDSFAIDLEKSWQLCYYKLLWISRLWTRFKSMLSRLIYGTYGNFIPKRECIHSRFVRISFSCLVELFGVELKLIVAKCANWFCWFRWMIQFNVIGKRSLRGLGR